jgi:hypothetical protein
MQPAAALSLVLMIATAFYAPARAQSTGDSLRIYAVNVVKKTPFEDPFTGYGIYLGRGLVITAFHVIGRLGFLKDPHVLVAGENLRATIIKEGSLEETDLTLLSIDAGRLPVSLQMRLNPLCKQPPRPDDNVFVVYPEKVERSRIISPLQIAPEQRKKFNTLIAEPEGSGSGVFDAERKCLFGIISRKMPRYNYWKAGAKILARPAGEAGYFVSAAKIAEFIPYKFRF